MGSEAPSTDAVAAQKPVISKEFPDPKEADFDDDISEEEKKYYMTKYKDLNRIKAEKLHCTACDRHMGCAARNDGRMRSHPMLRTLVCRACHAFYNSGEFERGDDGSELYCRWCGQGGQVYCCSSCPIVFCAKCVKRNFSSAKIKEIESVDDWKCFKCVSGVLWDLRATCWALLRYCDLKNKLAYITEDPELKEKYQKACLVDDSECCKKKKATPQGKKKDKLEEKKQEEKKQDEKKPDDKKLDDKKQAFLIKRMPEIHIRKFAHQDACFNPIRINKRPGSPLYKKITLANAPIPIAPAPPTPYIMSNPPMVTIPHQKKIKLTNIESLKAPPSPIITKTYSQRKIQKPRTGPMLNNTFNGFQTPSPFVTLSNDTINLSLDSLTQNIDERNKSTDEWARKRELANARMRKYRKRKYSISEHLDSMAQNEIATDEIKNIRKQQIEEEKAQQRKELAKERSRRYREMKRINALKTVDHLIHDSQIPGPSHTNPPFVTRNRSITFHDSQIAGTSTNMDIPLIMDHDSENENHNNEYRAEFSQANRSSATYSSCTRDSSAHMQFHKQFIQNEFGNACKICNRLWFKNDSKDLNDESMEFVRTFLSNIDENPIAVCSTCRASIQGLDIAAVSAYNEAQSQTDESMIMNEDDVVCTPDFPLEPLCEVTEDNNDDDVECITPGPLLVPRPMASMAATSPSVASTSTANMPPPLVPRISQEDIVQMTDNDVTINKSTGGLKFRVDPQTLSANKMYRLPDGRVFAINANPNMPGGYSATIVAVAETTSGMRNMPPPSRVTYAAKLSTVIPATPPPPPPQPRPNTRSSNNTTPKTVQTNTPKVKRAQKTKRKTAAEKTVDLKTPVEWYRYNLVDAEDLMSYVLKRLNKLKANAEITDLRKKDINEMKVMHKSFEQLLKTSITRFTEVKESLNQGYKEWSKAKSGKEAVSDDDVEILGDEGQPTMEKATANISADSDDPIFIDENSNDSVKITCDDISNANETLNAQTIVISDGTDNVNQDTVTILTKDGGTSRSSDKQAIPRIQEIETSSVPNLDKEEVTTNGRMDTLVGKGDIVPGTSNDAEIEDSVTQFTLVGKGDIVPGTSNDAEIEDSVTVELVNDPNLSSANCTQNTDVQVDSAENTDVQVDLTENTDLQVDPIKSEEDTELSSPINSEIPKNNSIQSSPISDEARNDEVTESSLDTVILKGDSTDGDSAKGDCRTLGAHTIKDDSTSSVLDRFETSEVKDIPSSQTKVCATLQESAIKVNGDNSEEIAICSQIEDNNEVDTTSDEDKNNISELPVDKTVSQTAEESSNISDNEEKKGVAEVNSEKNIEDKLLPTNSQGSDESEMNNSKTVKSDTMEGLEDESLEETITSKSANVDELKSPTDAVVKEIKVKAGQDLEITHREMIDKMDIDLDLNEEELLNGDKTEKGDGDRDDVAISDDLINDLLDDNIVPGGESKIPNLNIPCQP